MKTIRRWLCGVFGHDPQADTAEWPVIRCRVCDLVTFQAWPPKRSGWVVRP